MKISLVEQGPRDGQGHRAIPVPLVAPRATVGFPLPWGLWVPWGGYRGPHPGSTTSPLVPWFPLQQGRGGQKKAHCDEKHLRRQRRRLRFCKSVQAPRWGTPLFPAPLSSSSSQPSAARAEPCNCQTRRAGMRCGVRSGEGVPRAGPWAIRVSRGPSGPILLTLTMCLAPARCSGAYVGERCQLPNPCLSSPCKNAGTCIPVVRGSTVDYTCVCRLGFTDELCLTPRDNVCLSNPCRNGGTCDLLTLSEYKCRCPPGWSGKGVMPHGVGTW